MADQGRVLTGRRHRLARLLHAQGELVKVQEAALLQRERKEAALTAARRELDAIAAELGQARPAFLPAALQRLAATELLLLEARAEVEEARRKLLSAKGRQKSIAGRERLLRSAAERKAAEEDALEHALTMAAKASRKDDMVG
jgi:hypothetical protein